MPPEAYCENCNTTLYSKSMRDLSPLMTRHNLHSPDCDEFEIHADRKRVGGSTEEGKLLGTAIYNKGEQVVFEKPPYLTIEF